MHAEHAMIEVENSSSLYFRETMRQHGELYLVEGIVLLVLGIGAILIPVFASLAVAIFLGWLFLIGGIVGAVTTLMARHAAGFWWALLSSVVTIIAGLLLVGWPVVGVVSITLVLAAFLATDGIISILFAVEHRRQMTQRWGWLALNGAIDLVLAAVVIWALPAGAFWLLGLFIGIDFLLGGASLIAMSLATRHSEA